MTDAVRHFEAREEEMGPETMRMVERQVMLRIIDQKWREHLYEMDYLQEGINLRAMGQKDPLIEWQREGFDMFGQMMKGIAADFVRYIMHVQVTVEAAEATEDRAQNVQYSAPEDPVQGSDALRRVAPAAPEGGPAAAPEPDQPEPNRPVVKTEWEKTGRNEPCPCGSGKKYKQCHGR